MSQSFKPYQPTFTLIYSYGNIYREKLLEVTKPLAVCRAVCNPELHAAIVGYHNDKFMSGLMIAS